MAKKRTSLDSLFGSNDETTTEGREVAAPQTIESSIAGNSAGKAKNTERVKVGEQLSKIVAPSVQIPPQVPIKEKSDVIKQTVYLPAAVHEQLRQLAFEERRKMHDYLVEGLDRVFKNRGLKPYGELSKSVKQ